MQRSSPWLPFHEGSQSPINQALTLQFVLDAWLQTANAFNALKASLEKKERTALSAKFQAFSSPGCQLLKRAPLEKLTFYGHLLRQSSLVSNPIPLGSVLESLEQIARSIELNLSDLTLAESFCAPFEKQLKELFHVFFPFLEVAKADENVLFYLLEQRGKFNSLLGAHTIERIFQHFYPAGPAHLHAIVSEGYTRRGFSAFCAMHEGLIYPIEWRLEADPWSPKEATQFN